MKEWNHCLHSDWTNDVLDMYDVDFWGLGFGDISKNSLYDKIKKFNPEYIYLTIRDIYMKDHNKQSTWISWLPDLSNINIKKIFVGCDTQQYHRNDKWLNQFDEIYCRQPWWGYGGREYSTVLGDKNLYKRKLLNAKSWKREKLFRWSISDKTIIDQDYKVRKNILFIGRTDSPMYKYRRKMKIRFNDKVIFLPQSGKMDDVLSQKEYWDAMRSASALVCPSESCYGDFVPAKIFEYAASGSAILTNCDLVRYNMSDLDQVVIKYKDWDHLEYLIHNTDFTKYYNLAKEVIKNHTHKIRYKELFS